MTATMNSNVGTLFKEERLDNVHHSPVCLDGNPLRQSQELYFVNYFQRKPRLAHRKKPEAKTSKTTDFVAVSKFPIHSYFTGASHLTKDSVLRAGDHSYVRVHGMSQ